MATITISQFRKDLFQLVESAAKGEQVEFIHRGIRFRLVMPDQPPGSKLGRITPLATDLIVGTGDEFEHAHAKMTEEIVREWEAGWEK